MDFGHHLKGLKGFIAVLYKTLTDQDSYFRNACICWYQFLCKLFLKKINIFNPIFLNCVGQWTL